MTTPLSPSAQAVLDAVEDHGKFVYRNLAAAALEAAVQQVQSRQYGECFICGSADLLAIATELKQ